VNIFIMTLKELKLIADTMGVSITEARRLRRDILAHKYLDLMLAATYGDAGPKVRQEYKGTAEMVLQVANREEDTLYTKS